MGAELPSLEIPAIAELAQHPRWVCWKLLTRDGKPTKVPFNPRTGQPAATNNPATWAAYREACQAFVQSGQYAGVGFVFTASDPYVGVDLDQAIDESGTLRPESDAIVRSLASYTEISPSGRGLHIVVKAALPAGHRSRKGHTEVYSTGRYFTITGNLWPGAAETIAERTDAVLALVEGLEAPQRAPAGQIGASSDRVPNTDTAQLNRGLIGFNEPKGNDHPVLPAKRESLEAELAAYLDPTAVLPLEKFEVLCVNMPVVRETWEHTRRERKCATWSPSEWDLALANYFVAAGWTNQEVVHALIAHRHRWEYAPKLRADYYAMTLTKAWDARRGEREQNEKNEALSQARKEADPEGRRDAVLSTFSSLYGVTFKRVIKYVSDPPWYQVETDRGAFSGDVDLLINQRVFRKGLASAAGVVITLVKGAVWDKRAESLLEAAEEEPIGAETTLSGQGLSWVDAYLKGKPAAAEAYTEEAVLVGNPFHNDHDLYVVGADFMDWIRTALQVRMGPKDVGVRLRAAGCVNEVRAVTGKDGRRTSRSVWKLPSQYRRKD